MMHAPVVPVMRSPSPRAVAFASGFGRIAWFYLVTGKHVIPLAPRSMTLLITIGLSLLIGPLVQASLAARGTTLMGAIGWAWGAWLVWVATWIAAAVLPADSAAIELGWYATALVSVCPALFILGAKRPGSRVWTLFVVLPFLLVFSWPLLADWVRDATLQSFYVELPMRLGYALVLVMGFGNYVGTRWTIPAILIGVACGCIMWTFDGRVIENASGSGIPLRLVASCLLCLAGVMIWRLGRSTADRTSGLEGFWDHYRNGFGIVWAMRFLERVNAVAEKEEWSARLEVDHIRWREATAEEHQRTAERMETTIRWLARRFADPAWVDKHLQVTASDTASDHAPAS